MKKNFTLVLLLLLAGKFSFAQSIIQPVAYRGAFAPAPTAMWTDGWANWDPQNTVYPAATVTVTGNITANTTWTSGNTYMLDGVVYVDSLVTLTIEPGTVIRGKNVSSNSSLLIKRGARLVAEGTASSPIVFTSGAAPGSRNRGDWGGVILLGKAQNNLPGGVGFIEGLSQNTQNAHGGSDNADNSGIIKYVRIEFGGFTFATNNEINGLTMGSVGSGTHIDYVQTSFIQDDAFEWFGGSVKCSHLVSYQNLDDDFDTDNGFSGEVQFGLAVRDPNTADNPTVSTSEGFESDNDGTGSTNTPQTSAVFSNITIIGPYRGNGAATVALGFRRGARLRRNTALKIFNSIFMDHATGLFIDGPATLANATSGLLKYRNNLVALATPAHRVAEDAATRVVFFANSNDSLSTTAGVLVTPYNFTAPDYRPAAGSPALTNYDFSDPVLPVKLVKFYGQTIKKDNLLYWETATEVNNAGFELQRSADGTHFSKIAFISSLAADGNSTKNLKYSYVDNKALAGKSYYKLKQTDRDGRSTYSSVVSLEISGSEAFTFAVVYPNPVRDLLNVSVVSSKKQDATVVVSDMSGRRLSQKSITIPSGSSNYQVNVKGLTTGTYFLKVIPKDGAVDKVQKFIKQ